MRRLVLAQPIKRRLSNEAFVRPLCKFDSGYKARLDPGHAAGGGARGRIDEGRGAAANSEETLVQAAQRVLVETCPDPAGVAQRPALVVHAKQERAKSLTRARRLREAADHEFLLPATFHFDPRLRSSANIGGIATLRYDALEPMSARFIVKARPVAHYVVAVTQFRRCVAHEARKHAFAFFQRHAGEVVTVEMKQIEQEIDDVRLAARLDPAQRRPLAQLVHLLAELVEQSAWSVQRGATLAALASGVAVRPVPGPSAAVAAIPISGLSSETFSFHGRLPVRGPARRRRLDHLGRHVGTLILFEEARRFLLGIAEQGPLVIVLEDLHWADPGTSDALRALVSSLDPSLEMLAARPESSHDVTNGAAPFSEPSRGR